MSKAEELAKWILSGTWHEQTDYERSQLISIESELRRLAQMETEYVSLLKAISDAEPVAHLWQHGETGRTRIVMPDQIVTADANWSVVGPLYTLNGIKKP